MCDVEQSILLTINTSGGFFYLQGANDDVANHQAHVAVNSNSGGAPSVHLLPWMPFPSELVERATTFDGLLLNLPLQPSLSAFNGSVEEDKEKVPMALPVKPFAPRCDVEVCDLRTWQSQQLEDIVMLHLLEGGSTSGGGEEYPGVEELQVALAAVAQPQRRRTSLEGDSSISSSWGWWVKVRVFTALGNPRRESQPVWVALSSGDTTAAANAGPTVVPPLYPTRGSPAVFRQVKHNTWYPHLPLVRVLDPEWHQDQNQILEDQVLLSAVNPRLALDGDSDVLGDCRRLMADAEEGVDEGTSGCRSRRRIRFRSIEKYSMEKVVTVFTIDYTLTQITCTATETRTKANIQSIGGVSSPKVDVIPTASSSTTISSSILLWSLSRGTIESEYLEDGSALKELIESDIPFGGPKDVVGGGESSSESGGPSLSLIEDTTFEVDYSPAE